ncbi:UDP-glycosyltransferase 73E1-like protein [Tanacetum coccineum]
MQLRLSLTSYLTLLHVGQPLHRITKGSKEIAGTMSHDHGTRDQRETENLMLNEMTTGVKNLLLSKQSRTRKLSQGTKRFQGLREITLNNNNGGGGKERRSSPLALSYIRYVARRFNIPRLVFNGPGCFWLLCMHVFSSSNILERIESDTERFVLPGLPDRVEVTKLQIIGTSKEASSYQKGFLFRAIQADKAAYGIVVHTFNELEPEYVKEFSKVRDTKVWCIGPVSLLNKDIGDISERGNKTAINNHDCLKWLNEREPGSVLYVCLGSLARISTQQVIELGLGLESTNQPFIWCVKNKTQELDKWFLGFKERVEELHSALESICAGVPMVTWPFLGDQFLNEAFIVEILKIGVRIGVEIPVPFGEEEEIGVLVKKEDVKMAVECLMDKADEEGKQRRKRASELAEMAKRAMAEGGSSYRNISSLIQDITQRLKHN